MSHHDFMQVSGAMAVDTRYISPLWKYSSSYCNGLWINTRVNKWAHYTCSQKLERIFITKVTYLIISALEFTVNNGNRPNEHVLLHTNGDVCYLLLFVKCLLFDLQVKNAVRRRKWVPDLNIKRFRNVTHSRDFSIKLNWNSVELQLA